MSQGIRSYIPKKELENLYVKQKKSLTYISKKYHYSIATIAKLLRKYNIRVRTRREVTLHDIGGKKFGVWEVTHEHKEIAGHTRWKALCKNCGKYHWVLNRTLTHGGSKKCNLCNRNKRRGNCGELYSSYWYQLKSGAEQRNLEFNITLEEIWDLFLKQDRRCAFTGQLLTLGYKQKQTASLDRIDSTKGYTIDNVQWVHRKLNKMKFNMPNNLFIEWCVAIAEYQKYKNFPIYEYSI